MSLSSWKGNQYEAKHITLHFIFAGKRKTGKKIPPTWIRPIVFWLENTFCFVDWCDSVSNNVLWAGIPAHSINAAYEIHRHLPLHISVAHAITLNLAFGRIEWKQEEKRASGWNTGDTRWSRGQVNIWNEWVSGREREQERIFGYFNKASAWLRSI